MRHGSAHRSSATISKLLGTSTMRAGNQPSETNEEQAGMSARAALGDHTTTMTPRHAFMRHIPVFLALLAIGGIYALISEQFALGPRGVIPGLIVALVVLLLAALRGGRL